MSKGNTGCRGWTTRAGWLCMGLAVMLAQGCASTRIVGPDEPAQARVATQELQALNLRVVSSGEDDAGKLVAARVAQDVQSRLLALGYGSAGEDADVLVALKGEATIFDRSGNYYRHDGVLDAEVTLPRERRALGTQRFSERGERKLGETESLRQLADQLSGPVAEWTGTMTGPLTRELLVSEITLQRPRVGSRRAADAEYAVLFTRRVGALPGVIACELTSQDYAARRMTFRVVHYRRDFPEGLLNRLITIPELDLRP